MIDLDFAPDQSPHTPGNLTSISDFMPTVSGSYATTPGPIQESYSAPVASTDVIGSAVVKNKAGSALLYAGTRAKLLQANGTTGWTDRSAKAYSTAATGTWEFLQFGDTTYAANGADTIQKASGGAFADTATAPIARSIIAHENAIIALNLSTDSAGWARSDTGSDTFTVTASNDADSGTFLSGSGPVTAGTTFGNLAIAWKGDWMYGGRFVGDVDEKIRWDSLARGVGCCGQHAHISTEIGIIFVSNRDILLFDGSSPRSIADKVRKWFFGQLDPTQRANIWITHDEIDRCIYIWYPPSGSTYPTAALAYNYHSGKWGRLSSISSTANTFSYVRCPVRGANYTDYIAVGGMNSAANTLSANAVFATNASSSAGRLVNFSRNNTLVSRSGAPAMTSGYLGQADRDSRFDGLYIVPETDNWALAPASATATTWGPSLYQGIPPAFFTPAAIDGNYNINLNAEGRFHRIAITWTSGSGNNTEIRSFVPRVYVGGNR